MKVIMKKNYHNAKIWKIGQTGIIWKNVKNMKI